MRKSYKTVYREAEAEIVEKKSRFIACICPVEEEEQAMAFINTIRAKYKDASHHVYAYFIGGDNTWQKYSDAGEPQGTAGLPVLEAIRKQGLEDVVVVVTRYFGGTLLGAAGLVRAYGRSASEALHTAGIVQKKLCRKITVAIDYTLAGKVQSFLAAGACTIEDCIYGADVRIILWIGIDDVEAFSGDICELTCARASIEVDGTGYVMVDEKGNLMR